jgi:hypothetical protein
LAFVAAKPLCTYCFAYAKQWKKAANCSDICAVYFSQDHAMIPVGEQYTTLVLPKII